jgi:hypothetical protein
VRGSVTGGHPTGLQWAGLLVCASVLREGAKLLTVQTGRGTVVNHDPKNALCQKKN